LCPGDILQAKVENREKKEERKKYTAVEASIPQRME
jgi:hypothetical protein